MAAVLAGTIAVPVGIWFAGRTEISLSFIAAAVLFLPLFVFLPKLIRRGMKAGTDAAIDAFGKNEQVKKVFWALFVAMAGLMLARVLTRRRLSRLLRSSRRRCREEREVETELIFLQKTNFVSCNLPDNTARVFLFLLL